MVTIRKLIESSLRKINVLAGGEDMKPDEGQDALLTFQMMVSGWANETLTIPVTGVVTKTLVVGEPEYTIGIYPSPQPDPLPENHIETPRPQQFITAMIRDSAGTDYRMDIMDAARYSQISRKTNASRPSRMYVRHGWPMHTILFESQPYDSETLIMEVLQPLEGILATDSLDTVINLPPGYERALLYNLAVEMAPEYEKTPSGVVLGVAAQSLKMLKARNSRPLLLDVDRALVDTQKGKGTYEITQGP